MGIYVHLAVATERITDAAWLEIYDRARRVATQWQPRPLSLGWRDIGGVHVVQYHLDIETPEGLHIVGDAESLTTGESFLFPRQLRRGGSGAEQEPPEGLDVLVDVARWMTSAGDAPHSWRDLLGEKTQGLPYHTLIIALGALVENAVPKAAVVYGEISEQDCEEARRGLTEILGEPFELPIAADAARLRERLAPSLSARDLEQAVRMLGPTDPRIDALAGALVAGLRGSPASRVRHELEHVARTCAGPACLSAETRTLFQILIEKIRSALARSALREQLEHADLPGLRVALARRTEQLGMTLSAQVWDGIESIDRDDLSFMLAAACIATRQLDLYNAVRALLENRALWAMPPTDDHARARQSAGVAPVQRRKAR